jgi:hypothetical protein
MKLPEKVTGDEVTRGDGLLGGSQPRAGRIGELSQKGRAHRGYDMALLPDELFVFCEPSICPRYDFGIQSTLKRSYRLRRTAR